MKRDDEKENDERKKQNNKKKLKNVLWDVAAYFKLLFLKTSS